MNISAINTINNAISCKGFFSKSQLEKNYVPNENCKIIDTVKYYFPFADESIEDINKVTENNDKYNTATYSRKNLSYKFYNTVKIGEALPFSQKEYEAYKAACMSNRKMSSKESLIHSTLLKLDLKYYINETAETFKHNRIADILEKIIMRMLAN